MKLRLDEADSLFYVNPELALVKLDEIINYSVFNNKMDEEIIVAYISKGSLMEIQGDLDEAMKVFLYILPHAELLEDQNYVANIKRNIAHVKMGWGDSNGALNDMHESMRIAKLTNDTEMQSFILNDLAILHNDLGNSIKALDYLEEEIRLIKPEDEHGKAISLNNMGNTYVRLDDYDKALEYYFKSLKIVQGLNIKFGIRENLSDIGVAYQKKGNWEAAMTYHQDALQLSEELNINIKIAEELMHLGTIYHNNEDFKASIAFVTNALDLMSSDGRLQNRVTAYKLLSENYEGIGQYEKAYLFRKQYEIYKDSIADSDKIRQGQELEMRFQNERKEAENIQLKLIQTEQDLLLKRQNIVSLVIGAGFLIALGFLVFIMLQNEQKQVYNHALEEEVHERTRELEGALSELERFTYIASHDLKEPLRNISGFVSLIERNIEKDTPQKNKEYIQYVRKNTKQLYDLIQDILSYSSLNQRDVEVRYLSLQQMIAQFEEEHSNTIKSKAVSISVVDKSKLLLPSTLYLAVKNILSNGIKYNDKAIPLLNVSTIAVGAELTINIQDNGIGIDSKYYDKIFEMFSRLHDRGKYSGSGLGLAISKKVIEHFEGDIKLVSAPQKGSKFILTIPIKSLKMEKAMADEPTATISV